MLLRPGLVKGPQGTQRHWGGLAATCSEIQARSGRPLDSPRFVRVRPVTRGRRRRLLSVLILQHDTVNILFAAVPSGGDFDRDRIGSRKRSPCRPVSSIMWRMSHAVRGSQSHRLFHTREGERERERERKRKHFASSFQPVFSACDRPHLITTNDRGPCFTPTEGRDDRRVVADCP